MPKQVASRIDPHHSTLQVSQAISQCIHVVSQEFIATEERERQRLAMELHDYLTHLLVMAKMHLTEIRQNGHSRSGSRYVKKAEKQIDQALAYVHSVILDLYPKTLYEKGLSCALHSLFQNLKEVGLQVTLHHEPVIDAIPHEQSIFLFRSIRELLFNIIKHADVKEAQVYLCSGRRQQLKVVVEDKGKGFNPRTTLQGPGREKFGLSDMSRRAEALGVQFVLKSAPGEGTYITFTFPKPGKQKSCR